MSYQKLLILVVLLALSKIGRASNYVDSIQAEIKAAENPKKEVALIQDLAEYYMSQRAFESALLQLDIADTTASIHDYQEENAYHLYLRGRIYSKLNKNEKAIEYLKQSQVLAKELDLNQLEFKALRHLGLTLQTVGDFNKSIHTQRKALGVALRLNDTKEVAFVENFIGQCYVSLANYDSASHFFKKSLTKARNHSYKQIEGLCLTGYGIMYQKQGLYSKSINSYIDAIELYESVKDSSNILGSLNNVAMILTLQKDYERALEYYYSALDIAETPEFAHFQTPIRANIGLTLDELGNYDEALEQYFIVLESSKRTNNKYGIALITGNLGGCYYHKEEFETAKKFLMQSIEVSSEINAPSVKTLSLITLGKVNIELNRLNEAESLFKEALAIATENDEPIHIQSSLEQLSSIKAEQGDFEQSLDYYKRFHLIADSLFGIEKNKQITEIEAKFNLERKQQQIKNLEQENAINELELEQTTLRASIAGVLMVLAIAVIAALYFFTRQRNLNLEKKSQETEQKVLRLQMNPHFIFNSLVAIQDFIGKQNNDEAEKYLSRFSKLMRQTLENSRNEFIPLEEEVLMLENYMSLQNLRRNHPFAFSISIDDELDPEEVKIPPMFAQPFLENAVEHGINADAEDGSIEVRFSLENDFILLEVIDNGVGYSRNATPEGNAKKKHKSLALTITKERIDLMRKRFDTKIDFNLSDLDKGTRVVFKLPFTYS